jgi:hypothetical protein
MPLRRSARAFFRIFSPAMIDDLILLRALELAGR